MPCLHFKLRQDGVAKGLCGDARAIGYEKNSAVGHGGECEKVAELALRADTLK